MTELGKCWQSASIEKARCKLWVVRRTEKYLPGLASATAIEPPKLRLFGNRLLKDHNILLFQLARA
jgi:hypothetical protein